MKCAYNSMKQQLAIQTIKLVVVLCAVCSLFKFKVS